MYVEQPSRMPEQPGSLHCREAGSAPLHMAGITSHYQATALELKFFQITISYIHKFHFI